MIVQLCNFRPNPEARRFCMVANARVTVSPAGLVEIVMVGPDPTNPSDLVEIGTQLWRFEDLVAARDDMSMAWQRLRRTIIQ